MRPFKKSYIKIRYAAAAYLASCQKVHKKYKNKLLKILVLKFVLMSFRVDLYRSNEAFSIWAKSRASEHA